MEEEGEQWKILPVWLDGHTTEKEAALGTVEEVMRGESSSAG